jgi:diguanylate cyclase (GGDEF)-like protein
MTMPGASSFPGRGVTVYGVAGLAVTGAYFVLPAGSAGSHLAYEVLALAGLAAVLFGVARHRRHDVGWRLIALGLAIWVAGDSYWNGYRIVTGHEAPFPSVADALYLVCYVPLIVGVLVFVRGGRPRLADLLDGAIVGAGATLVIWFAVVAPVASESHSSELGARIVVAAYPVADNLLLVALIQLILARGFGQPALRYLAAAFAMVLATDIVYARARVSATFTPGAWLNAGYLLFYVLLGCAFLSPSIARLRSLSDEPARTISKYRIMALSLPLLILPGFVAAGGGRSPVDADVLAAGGALISLLVVTRLVLVFRERDLVDRARLQAQEQLAQMAYRDPLTGLANRSALYEAVDGALVDARAAGRAVALLFVDVDGFKIVNDRYGHADGDVVLRDVAGRLKLAVRERDLVARHGGDEFVVVMFGLPRDQAYELAAGLAARLEAEFARPFEIGGRMHTLSITSGFSVYPADGASTQELVDTADRAMYRHKLPSRPVLQSGLAL